MCVLVYSDGLINIQVCLPSTSEAHLILSSHNSIRNILRTKAVQIDMIFTSESIYAYQPSHAAPIILSVILGASLGFHIYQGL
jgi:hypothetical protein